LNESFLLGVLVVLLVLGVVELLAHAGAELEPAVGADLLQRLQELKLFGVSRTVVVDRLGLGKLVSRSVLLSFFCVLLNLP
jgi:hypothetical protein